MIITLQINAQTFLVVVGGYNMAANGNEQVDEGELNQQVKAVCY